MPAERGRWGLVLIGMVINLCLGTIYSWSVFVAPLTSYFQGTTGQTVTAGEILMPFSVFLAFFAIAMILTGKYIESIGPRRVTIVGGILTGLGWLLASTVTSVWMLNIVYGVIGGIGVGIAYGVPVAVAARWFPDRRGTAVGLTLLGFGFSAFITANLAGYLIGMTGVMNTFRIFGIVFIILILLLSVPLRFPPDGWKPAGWTPPVPREGEEVCECNRSKMIRTPAFYGLWFCFFIGCLAGLMAISIAKPVGTEIGIATGLATLLVGFFAIFNGGGRPVFGALTDRFTPRNTAIISFILIALASTLRLSPLLRRGIHRLRGRCHCRSTTGRVHQDDNRQLPWGIPLRADPLPAGNHGCNVPHEITEDREIIHFSGAIARSRHN